MNKTIIGLIGLIMMVFMPVISWAAVPNAPSGLTATTMSAVQINLSWTDNSTDETSFLIERKTGAGGTYSQIGTVGTNVTTYSSTGLTQNTTYYYRVRAYNSSGYSAYSNEMNATTSSLNAPTNLSISSVTYTKISLTWTDNSSDEGGFSIERKTGAGGIYSQVATVSANTTSYTNTGLTQGTEYYYRVRAYNGSNYSPYTNEVNAITSVLPSPSDLSAATLSCVQINLSWIDNSTDETSFLIERKTGAGGAYSQIGSVGTNVTTYSSTGLTQNTTYYYRVRAYNSSNSAYSAYSNEISATTSSLNAPTNLSISSVTYTKISLTWTDNSSDEGGFSIERKTGAGGTYSQVATVSANTTSYTNTGLTQGTEYYYRVRAYNGSNYSPYTNEMNSTTLFLNAPSGLTATNVVSTQVTLAWTDNSGDETGFAIERKTGTGSYSQIATVGANVTNYTNTGLTQNTAYYYRVRAYNGSDYSVYSNEIGVTTATLLSPSGLSATPLSSAQIQLAWSDNSGDEAGFAIERKTGTGNYSQIATVGANVTTYTNTGLTQNTAYYYRIRSYNGSNYSTYSNEASASTLTLLPPSGLTATPVFSTKIQLTWTDNSQGETGFSIERKTGTGNYSQVSTVGANVVAYLSTNLTRNTEYFFRVRAYEGSNYSAYSNEVKATTPDVDAPSNLTAVPLSSSEIKLTWTDNSTNETDFYIEFRVGTEGDYSLLSSVAANLTSYVHSSLMAARTYYYRIRAYNGVNYSSYSNEVNATTPTCVQEGTYQP